MAELENPTPRFSFSRALLVGSTGLQQALREMTEV